MMQRKISEQRYVLEQLEKWIEIGIRNMGFQARVLRLIVISSCQLVVIPLVI